MPPTPRNAYAVSIEDGRDVVIVELAPSEYITAARDAGKEQAIAVRGAKVLRAAVRMAVRKVGGVEVNYAKLAGPGWYEVFPNIRDQLRLAAAFAQVHIATDDEVSAVVDSMAAEVDANGEVWTIRLPANDAYPKGRVVTMAQVRDTTVDDALREAELSARSEAAQAFAGHISSARRALRTVDGAPVTADDLAGKGWDARFSVRETYLLGAAFSRIHAGLGESLGEMKPVRL